VFDQGKGLDEDREIFMGFQVSGVQQIGGIEKRGLKLLLMENIGDPIVNDLYPGLLETKHLLQVVFCRLGNGKYDGSFFPDLPHEKFPGLYPEGRPKKMGELEMDQIVDRDDQPLGEKKRKNIMGRKIKVIAEFSCLERDLHMLPEIIILCRHFDDTIPWHIKSIRTFQMNGSAM
jgi:hypothetical protein